MVNIVMEYMDGGSLQDVVERGGCNDESVVAQIAKQVCACDSLWHLPVVLSVVTI